MEAVAIKARITPDMLNQDCYILTDYEAYKTSEYGEPIAIKLNPGIDRRSLEQLGLYWKCVELKVESMEIDDPIWNTKEKAHKQIRWMCQYINRDSAVHLMMPDGTSRLYFELDSIAFDKSNQKKVNAYFDMAIPKIAESMDLTEDELIEVAKSRMQSRRICKLCGGRATDRHHLLPQTKQNRALYGKLIDDPANIIYLCNDCHLNKSIPHMTEKEFCEKLNIEIKSKSGRTHE